jgi:hypothetical protein
VPLEAGSTLAACALRSCAARLRAAPHGPALEAGRREDQRRGRDLVGGMSCALRVGRSGVRGRRGGVWVRPRDGMVERRGGHHRH